MADAQYVDTEVARYKADLREWTEADAHALLSADIEIEKSTYSPTDEDNDSNVDQDMVAGLIQPLVLYSNTDGEEVALLEEGIAYTDRSIKNDWHTLINAVTPDAYHQLLNAESTDFSESERYVQAIALLQEKLQPLHIQTAIPYFAIDMNQEANEPAVELPNKAYGIPVEKESISFIYVEFSACKDGIPFFTDYRESKYAPAPGLSAILTEMGIQQILIFADYYNFENLNATAPILRVDHFLDNLPSRIKRAVRSAQSVRLQYVAFPSEEGKYLITPCWSFYTSDGQLIFDIDAISGMPV